MKNQNILNPILVFYDGLCMLCSKEINHYKKQIGSENLIFIDICDPNFRSDEFGLDPKRVHKYFHVRKHDGVLVEQLDAFIEIWKQLPKYRFLAQTAQNPLAKKLLSFGYSVFAEIRPYLPRKSKAESCRESPYCDLNQK